MKKFNTITASKLFTKDIPPLPFVVNEILPAGLTILAGDCKVGKSWFAFWLAMQVANGEDVWGFKTTQGTTLYLAFEDNHARVQDRLYMLEDEFEKHQPMHICVWRFLKWVVT